MPILSPQLLANYRALIAKVDELCDRIVAEQAANIRCRPGCDSCCRHLSLLAVEAAAVFSALARLPAATRQILLHQAANATENGPCPLLIDGRCAIYPDRPVICRTHGLPLLLTDDAGRRVDFCPENFQGVESLPAGALVDLDRLNQLLVAVNALYTQQSGAVDQRSSLAELIRRTASTGLQDD